MKAITYSRVEHVSPANLPVEIVERKGAGHPDTLSDALAEHLSLAYSNYCLEHFGAILRHQFDKTAIMCGRARVAFGGGEILDPIRILLNGRASGRLGDCEIPLREILIAATQEFFRLRFPMLNPMNDLRILFEVRSGNNCTTGGIHGDGTAAEAPIHFRFNPRTLADLPETRRLEANDTSLACGWGPYTDLERTVLAIDSELTSDAGRKLRPWLGSDIKILASRHVSTVSCVIAVPILSSFTPTPEIYFERVAELKDAVRALWERSCGLTLKELVVNSGDDLAARKLYMNFTGSSIESGDEGMVGRGNRIGGLIAPFRPTTMEGIGGKNPRYHVGKVYSAAAWDISMRISSNLGLGNNVLLINRMAEPLDTPWRAFLETESDDLDQNAANAVFEQVLSDLPGVTNRILKRAYPFF